MVCDSSPTLFVKIKWIPPHGLLAVCDVCALKQIWCLYSSGYVNGKQRTINNSSQSTHCFRSTEGRGFKLIGCWAQISTFSETESRTASLIPLQRVCCHFQAHFMSTLLTELQNCLPPQVFQAKFHSFKPSSGFSMSSLYTPRDSAEILALRERLDRKSVV